MNDDLISRLSEIRSKYNCFDENEEPYYRALSETIRVLSQRADGDTISRAEAIEVLNKLARDNFTLKDAFAFYLGALHDASDEIKALPSAERRGKWIHDGKDFPHGCDWIHCSVCGARGINVPADLTNYCPNCGARMERDCNETKATPKRRTILERIKAGEGLPPLDAKMITDKDDTQ